MILVFTDFGLGGSYMGEMRAAILRRVPRMPVVDLVADAPAFRPDLAAFLLAALWPTTTARDVVLAVVDPGVGTDRLPLAIEVDGRWLVGPDNGLFEPILRRAERFAAHRIVWQPPRLSASFHGRDLFAPVAAMLARGERPELAPVVPRRFPDWPDDLPAIVHVDGYGNAVTGLRAATLAEGSVLRAAGRTLQRARTFGEVPAGAVFWYENSSGLAEIAVNGGRAAAVLGLEPGSPAEVGPP
ncbi:MAG TPA: SAM-dependent chlorinase/fluorinase [Geminicoccaceae bacterium]|nr:SAM-dependent chlorinase/fluorinase [Geminicoccus sp.]HMU50320.1 SAM-dependent chlorinase/fluorinase [Geminicoccaceae bacterium]